MKNRVRKLRAKLLAFALIITLINTQETRSTDADSSSFYGSYTYPGYGYHGDAGVLEATLLDASSIEARQPAYTIDDMRDADRQAPSDIEKAFEQGVFDPFFENAFRE